MVLPESVRTHFDHVSIAVRSIDQAYAFFQRYFPTEPRNPKSPTQMAGGSFQWQDLWLGRSAIEFIEDLPGEEGFVTRFIRRRGEGLHHLCFEVGQLDPIVAILKADGARVVDEERFADGGATAFISPRSAFGTLVQFWQMADTIVMPPPPEDERVRLDHVALAVRDLARAMRFFGRYFPSRAMDRASLGENGTVRSTQMEVAGLGLELIQGADDKGANFITRFIERYGEGMHHISVDVKDYDARLRELKKDGVRVVDEGVNRRGQRRFFISPRSAFGVPIQVCDWTRKS